VSDAGELKLICLDLDGTALDFDARHLWLADPLVDVLNAAGRRGIAWCTNSGRGYQNQLGLIQACRPLDNMPVALLSGERFIHWLEPRFQPHEPFNSLMQERMKALYPRVVAAVTPHKERLRAEYEFNYEHDIDLIIGWNLVSQQQAPALVADLEGILAGVPDAQVLRNGAWVVINHRAAGKGVVLREVCDRLKISRENVLAIGDHLNDLDMLDGRAAAHTGCPADAHEDLQATVRAAGGIISQYNHTAGTVDIIRQALA
jgi:hydroxymethylpyrimidine pyrophosphatase-like HAD family hydrolase